MAIEVWSSDADGMLALMPESPDPDVPHGEVPVPPEPEPSPPPAPEPSQSDELRALRRMAEEQRQEAARQAGQMETVTKLLRGEDLTPPANEKPAPLVRPKNEDFTTFEEYEDARDTYFKTVAKQEAAQEIAAFRQEQQREFERQALVYRIHQTEQAFAQEHADYNEVVTNGIATKPKPFLDFIQQELGPNAVAVAYHMSKDEALTQRMMQMPIEMLRAALWQLSGAVGGGQTGAGAAVGGAPPPTETPSPGPRVPPAQGPGQAAGLGGGRPSPVLPTGVSPAGRPKPAPPRPLGGVSAGVPSGYRDDMTMKEFNAWRDNGGGR